jgi:hypothetical protein
VSASVEGHVIGILLGLGILCSILLAEKRDIANEKWFTPLDQRMRREKIRSKWYYWPCALISLLLVILVIAFIIHQALLVVKLLWVDS